MKNNPRELVLNTLIDVFEKDRLSHLALRKALEGDFSKNERNFITRLFEGTVEKLYYLDFVIDCFSKTKTDKMKAAIKNILRMAVFELEYMDSVPESATCNEAVKLAKAKGFGALSGFVNAVIRNIARDISAGKPVINERLMELESDKKLEVTYNIPIWIIKKWTRDYGKEKALKMAEALSESDSKTSVRMNLSKADKVTITESLKNDGVTFEETPYAPGLYLSDFDRLDALKAFKEGLIQPQDLSSMMVGLAAAPKKGDIVLDLCAAPGGKSLHLADLGANVTSFDLTEKKVALINDNIKRCGFKNMEARQGDAREYNENLKSSADIVIVDAPCSGLGVISKKSDIKYKTKQIDIKTLSELQKEILKNAYAYLKPGGVLIFSTCTVNKNENDKNVKWMEEELGLVPDDLSKYLDAEITGASETAKEGFIQLFPGKFPGDGFFISRMIKK